MTAAVPFEVRVDPDRCMGSGQCVSLAPKAFSLDSTSVAEVLDDPAPLDDIERAAAQCPNLAIVLVSGTALADRRRTDWS